MPPSRLWALRQDAAMDAKVALKAGRVLRVVRERALPDGELPDGWPIPAIVPLPGLAMPIMPAKVHTVPVDRGDFGVLSGRRPAGGLLQGPDSAQAIIKLYCGEDEPGWPAGA